MLGRNIFNYNIDKWYCEDCKVFDDYLLFLNVLNLHYTSSLNIYFINLKNIYIYYKAHISSVCYQNSSNNNDNISILVDKFETLKKLSKQIKLKIPCLYINNYKCDFMDYKIIDNKTINYDYNKFKNTKQYKLNIEYLNNLSNILYICSVIL